MSFTSCAAKSAIAEILIEAGCEEVSIPTKHWFRLVDGEESVVKQLWDACLAEAAPSLLEEGFIKKAVDEDASPVVKKVDWKRVPSSLFICVLGLDFLVTTDEGDTVGVITNLHKDNADMETLIKRRPLLDYLGIDALVWCQLKLSSSEIGCITHYTNRKKQLAASVRQLLTDIESEWMHEWTVEAANSSASEVEAEVTSAVTVTATRTV